MTQKPMTQAAYARHRGISPARVSILIRDGKIPASCYETQSNGRRLIDVLKADQALSENLDQLRNPRRGPDPVQLQAQETAADYACDEDEDGRWWPAPYWELRYIIKIMELCPELIECVEKDCGVYHISITDVDKADGTSYWSVNLNFSFGNKKPRALNPTSGQSGTGNGFGGGCN